MAILHMVGLAVNIYIVRCVVMVQSGTFQTVGLMLYSPPRCNTSLKVGCGLEIFRCSHMQSAL